MVKFDLYFKTPELYDRIVPLMRVIPAPFELVPTVGIPPIEIISETDPLWCGFPFPTRPGDVYIFDDEILAGAVGGAVHMRASVRVRPIDSDSVVILRIWHELLHAAGQPADDMTPLADQWIESPVLRLLWHVWPKLFGSRDVPFWQYRYYAWLTKRIEE